jgi:hypothetical protein
MGTTLEQIVVEPRRLANSHLVGQRRRVGAGGTGISATDGGGWIDAAYNLMRHSPVIVSAILRLHLKCPSLINPLVKHNCPVYYY